MKSISSEHVLDEDGVLRLDLPLGPAEAGRKVRVTVTLLPRPMSQEEYQRIVNELAGSWEGPFELPDDPPPVERGVGR